MRQGMQRLFSSVLGTGATWLAGCQGASIVPAPGLSASGETHLRVTDLLTPDKPPLPYSLVTDRPDFTESTEPVPPGYVQIEAGYTFTYDRERGQRVRDHTAPELLVRLGMMQNVELRIGWEGYTWTSLLLRERTDEGRRVSREDSVQGSNDLSLGVKVKLFEQDRARPHFGVIGEITVPSGTPAISSGDVDPLVALLWAYDLSDGLALGGNVNVGVPTEDGHRFVQAASSLSLGIGLTDSVGTYVEYFGLYPAGDGEDAAHSLNGGFTFLLSNDFQLDLRAGFGLNREADDFFAGLGFALRL